MPAGGAHGQSSGAVDANLQRMGLAAAPAADERERPNRADCQILGECSPTAHSRDLD